MFVWEGEGGLARCRSRGSLGGVWLWSTPRNAPAAPEPQKQHNTTQHNTTQHNTTQNKTTSKLINAWRKKRTTHAHLNPLSQHTHPHTPHPSTPDWTEAFASPDDGGGEAAKAQRIADMGFSLDAAKDALRAAGGDENAALEALLGG